MSDERERRELISWLIENLPGGPEVWTESIIRLTRDFSSYTTRDLHKLKVYAEKQIKVYREQQDHFEKFLTELRVNERLRLRKQAQRKLDRERKTKRFQREREKWLNDHKN